MENEAQKMPTRQFPAVKDRTEDRPDIGKQLKAWRKYRKLSQQELAEKAGLSLSTVVKIENDSINDPGLDTAAALADVLGITLDQLAEGAPPIDFKGGIIRE